MKGDFTRDTFDPKKHYQQVLMQQGRVQLDADWNEQSAITTRRDETTAADLIGDCGGPAENAAFGYLNDPPANKPAAEKGDFYLSAGHYYIDGIQCQLEESVLLTEQPDCFSQPIWFKRKENPSDNQEFDPGNYLLYLDVWQRHVTINEDKDIREAALVGPDTGTRIKTVWQVRAASLNAPIDPNNPCHQPAAAFDGKLRKVLPRLAAKATAAASDVDPCTVPASAGYRGLENQLYRVEVHALGDLGKATFKWSRENGTVVTRITNSVVVPIGGVNENWLTVASTGLDKNLGFKKGSHVEIIHESEELEGIPGTLALIEDVVDAAGIITLPEFDTDGNLISIDLKSNPRLRRWEGFGNVAVDLAKNEGFVKLENGIEIKFDQPAGAEFRTGDYWQIPARTASPDAQSGKIEWPEIEISGGTTPQLLSPIGIVHHYCRLAVVSVSNEGTVTPISDCRCLWPALTAVPRLFYVSGDGQEVMPDLTAPAGTLFKLPRPLIVGVANGHCQERPVSVRFDVVNSVASPSAGQVVAAGGAPFQNFAIMPLDANGLAKCDFHLDGVNPTQQVTARLLDAKDQPVSMPIIFNANLSIAGQVAYQPEGCDGLAGQKTVQDAIARLASQASVYKVSGDGQQASAGAKLKEPLLVRVANCCGPVAKMTVTFKVILGGGSITPSSSTTDANGEAIGVWTLGGQSTLQVAEAEVVGDAARPITEPHLVHFIAHLTGEGSNDPAPVRVVDVRLRDPAKRLPNDQRLTLAELKEGVDVFCDRIIDENTVQDPQLPTVGRIKRGQPTCFVTAEIPYPILPSEQTEVKELDLKSFFLVGYRPLILHSEVRSKNPNDDQPGDKITWKPAPSAYDFLSRVLGRLNMLDPPLDEFLLRLTLKGNFIWSEEATRLFEQGVSGGYLDGESFRAPKDPKLLLPSGDNRRGGDFEMWFWLRPSREELRIDPDSLVDFGLVPVATQETRNVMLFNETTKAMTVIISTSGEAFGTKTPRKVGVAANAGAEISVTFQPPRGGSFQGALTIESADIPSGAARISLSGTAAETQ